MNPHYVAVGASRGLGAVFAKMVVAAGGRVSVISRSRAVAPPAGHSSGIGGYQCDITDKDQVCATLAAIRRERGEFDGVVFFQRYRGDGDGWAGEMAVSLTATKDAPVVVFCLSSQCWLSYNTALRLVAAGFTNVQWYRGGVEAWQGAGLPLVQSVIHAQF